MFDKQAYKYKFIQSDKPVNKDKDVFLKRHIFTFYNQFNRKYIVWVEEYDYHTFIIKFHLKCHNHRDDRYNLLVNNKDAPNVLKTVLTILVSFYHKNPYASFGFLAAHTNEEDEEAQNNKRFRVYKGIMIRFFPPSKFKHTINKKDNIYFLINRDFNEPDLATKIIMMFKQIYPFFFETPNRS